MTISGKGTNEHGTPVHTYQYVHECNFADSI